MWISVPGNRKIALQYWVHFIGISDICIFVVTPLLVFAVYRIDAHGPGFLLLMSLKRRTHERYEGSVIAGMLRAFALGGYPQAVGCQKYFKQSNTQMGTPS